MKKINVFIASPNDVEKERQAVKDVIDKLNKNPKYNAFFRVNYTCYTENGPWSAMNHPQEQISAPSEADMFIMILWSKIGTPYTYEGKNYSSGTIYEFEKAKEAHVKNNSKKPDLYVFRKTTAVTIPPNNAKQLESFNQLQNFIDETFYTNNHEVKIGLNEFDSVYEFKKEIQILIEKNLNKQLKEENIMGDGWVNLVLPRINFNLIIIVMMLLITICIITPHIERVIITLSEQENVKENFHGQLSNLIINSKHLQDSHNLK